MKPQLMFTKRLQALFGAPDAAVATEVIAEYVNALDGYTETELNRAADRIARTRRIRSWPTVAECIDAAEEAKRNPTEGNLKIIGNFDRWWGERLAGIDTAATEADIGKQLDMIRPYHEAKWIADKHWNEAVSHAEQRRKKWKAEAASKIALRTIGESAK